MLSVAHANAIILIEVHEIPHTQKFPCIEMILFFEKFHKNKLKWNAREFRLPDLYIPCKLIVI